MSHDLLVQMAYYRLKQESEALENKTQGFVYWQIVSKQIFVITPLNIELAISFCQQGADLS